MERERLEGGWEEEEGVEDDGREWAAVEMEKTGLAVYNCASDTDGGTGVLGSESVRKVRWWGCPGAGLPE
jgi:hypothetical protein